MRVSDLSVIDNVLSWMMMMNLRILPQQLDTSVDQVHTGLVYSAMFGPTGPYNHAIHGVGWSAMLVNL